MDILYRITVEDMFQSKTNPNDLRFHNLKYMTEIKKVADNIGGSSESQTESQPYTASDESTTIYSVADLYNFVKMYDEEFTPSFVVDEHLIEDGRPKVFYHGTDESFDEFKYSEIAFREGSFFFAENREDAEAYGKNVYEVYLRGKKLADYDNQPSEFYRLKDKKTQGVYDLCFPQIQ